MNRSYWNEIASRYEEQIFSVFDEERNSRLLSYVEKHSNSHGLALDLGCGTGKAFGYLTPRFKKVIAIDFAENLLEIARANAPSNVEIVKADLIKDSITTEADFILCCNVAMFPDVEKNYGILKNIGNSVKPDGAAIVVIPSLESIINKSWMTAEWFRKDGVRFEEIPKSQWSDFKFGTKSFLLGLIDIDGVITKHYLRSEIFHLFRSAGLAVTNIDRLEYNWNTEFESPPSWMREPYPWDWLVECRKLIS